MKPEEKLKELIGKSDVTIDLRTKERILGEALENLGNMGQNKTQSAQPEPNIGKAIMKSKTVRFAAAAVIILACVIGLSLWRNTGSGIALADVLAHVEQVKVFRCKGTFKMTSYAVPDNPYQWEVHYTYLESQEYGTKVRREVLDPNGGKKLLGETYSLPLKEIEIDHLQKKYTLIDFDNTADRPDDKVSSRYSDPRAFLNEIMTCKHENLGRSTVDDINVEGFRTTDPNCRGSGFGFRNPQVDVKLWVDVKTHLPVRYESLKSGLDEMGNRMSHYFMMHDFQWDFPVDASEFEPPAAQNDYIVIAEKPLGPVNQETAIHALRQCVDLFDEYPESLSVALPRGLQLELDRSNSPAAIRLKEELKALTEQDKLNRLMDIGRPIRLLFEFYVMELVEDNKDPAYHGDVVTPQDTEKVLLRWKAADDKYRVIYGDLGAETVSPEKLAQLEAALPK